MDRLVRLPPRTLGLVLCMAVFITGCFLGFYANHYRMMEMLRPGSDPWGYYQFLPALIGVHPIGELPWAMQLETGKAMSLFTMGVAFLQAPFFFLAALVAKLTGHPVDGYSMPFAWARITGAAFYTAVGCNLLFHVLRRRFVASVAVLTPLLLFTATNLWYYTGYESGMSHVYAFFLFAWLLYLTVRMLEAPRADRLLGLFVCAALIVLIRQLNAIALLVPLFYGAPPKQALRIRWQWLKSFPKMAVSGVLLGALVMLPQVLYWKYVTGDPVVFTYGKKGEGFFWTDPHLLDVLFSHQNGWFIYTPLMLAVMVAMIVKAVRGEPGFRTVLLVWVLAWYVYSAWWNWWLGGAFGHRGFVEHLAFLSIGLAVVVDRVRRLSTGWRTAAMALGFLLVFFNVRISTFYNSPWDGPDWTWARLLDVWNTVFLK